MKTHKNVKLSVVVPTYNSTSLILRCLESLERQNARKWEFEVIIVNDGSKDNTFQALEEYASQTSLQLRIFHLPHIGPALARNHGVENANSEWIAFLDADMIANPNWISRGLKLISQEIPVGGFEGRTEVGERKNITPFTHQMTNVSGGRYPTCNIILRRHLCHFYYGYKIPFREDTDLAFSILESGFEIIFDRDLIAYHPPLAPNYKRPIKLALRYYYDGLLAKRFPEKYNDDVDVHWICGFRIPHLRRKIYGGFVFTQLLFLFLFLVPFLDIGLKIFGGGMHVLAYAAVLVIHLKNVKTKQLVSKDIIALLAIAYLVPWVLMTQWTRGKLAFRNEPVFAIPPKRERRNAILLKHIPKRSRKNKAPGVPVQKSKKRFLGSH